jgi:YbbR domain-containing protein
MSKLFENLWIKLAALLLAFLLWFHVATDKVYEYEFNLKLKQIDMTEDLALGEAPPTDFRVVVSATGKKLLRSDWKKSGLKLMVDRSRPGRFKINFDKGNLSLIKPYKIELLSIVSPREAVLDCEQKIRKKVPVKSALNIIPDNGFALDGNDSLAPNMVFISGPQNRLRSIDSIVTVSETYRGVRNNLSMRIALAYPDIYGIEIFPDTISYMVNVLPLKTRIFPNIPVKLINQPSKSASYFSVEPKFVELRVSGIPESVDSLDANDISVIADFNQANSLGFVPVVINIPESISILNQSIDSVRIMGK